MRYRPRYVAVKESAFREMTVTLRLHFRALGTNSRQLPEDGERGQRDQDRSARIAGFARALFFFRFALFEAFFLALAGPSFISEFSLPRRSATKADCASSRGRRARTRPTLAEAKGSPPFNGRDAHGLARNMHALTVFPANRRSTSYGDGSPNM